MDQIFKDHIGNQFEVYVDDIVVKSKTEMGHVENLASIFKVLRRYQLRLNLKKCSFKIKAENANAIIGMRSPRSVKEVQRFIGQITALGRFQSRLKLESHMKSSQPRRKSSWPDEVVLTRRVPLQADFVSAC
ncbi:Retrovirus-related Pol polyprotein from transposon opus, partial [Mucuna pruriens]